MTRPTVLMLLMLAAAALAFALLRGEPAPAVTTPQPTERPEQPQPPAAVQAVAAPNEVTATETQPQPTAERAPIEPGPIVEWDPEARADLTIRVVDDRQRPVAGADVRLWGLRSKQDPGSHFGWRGEEPTATTGGDGEVRLWFPVWVARRHETALVTVRVDHPRYPSTRTDVEIATGSATVVLEPGAFVTVSGWIGDPGNVITAVEPHMSWSARITHDDWLFGTDRKPSTHRLPNGHHALYLTHTAQDGRYYSEPVAFDVAGGERRDFHLQLERARSLRGRLDDAVPRPVRNGSVMANFGIRLGTAGAGRPFTAAVGEDGTFELADVPRGRAQIIGICDGWVSAEQPTAEDPERLELQALTLDDAAAEPFVLRMRRAATFVATVVGPDGKPVAGARVALWPNVHWDYGASEYFMRREYEATTDARGVATITDLPPGDEDFVVRAEGLSMPLRAGSGEAGERTGSVALRPGEVHRVRVELERVR